MHPQITKAARGIAQLKVVEVATAGAELDNVFIGEGPPLGFIGAAFDSGMAAKVVSSRMDLDLVMLVAVFAQVER